MPTITLYKDKLNGVGGLIDNIVKSSNNLETQLGTLKSTLQGVLLNIRIIKYYNYCNPVIKITNDIIVITVQPMYLPAISQSDGSAFSTFRI